MHPRREECANGNLAVGANPCVSSQGQRATLDEGFFDRQLDQ